MVCVIDLDVLVIVELRKLNSKIKMCVKLCLLLSVVVSNLNWY